MTIEDILHHIQIDTEMTVLNEPFTYSGKTVVTLEGGDIRYWFSDINGALLSIAPEDEEIIFFQPTGEDLEAHGEIILFRNKEYEFSYEDVGSITETIGETDGDEGDKYTIADYEADDGELIRTVINENSGESFSYVGQMVVEDDILNVR